MCGQSLKPSLPHTPFALSPLFLAPTFCASKGPVGGVNTNLTVDGSAWSSPMLGDAWDHSKSRAGRLQPAYSGKLVRIDLADFTESGVEVGCHVSDAS